MNTPQRTTPQRRPRRNISGPTTSTAPQPRQLHTVQSAGCMETRTQRPRRQRSSVSLCGTPKPNMSGLAAGLPSPSSRTSSNSSLYAGSKFTDSPMARHVPQPPCNWLTEFQRPASAQPKWRTSPTPSTASSGMASISETDPESPSCDSVDELVLPPVQSKPAPIRVHPLQLISACAAV
ncbi:unnamed protein product [Bursaphelenchus xylophilus]|uniref:(pine wood nematode) hypothetical protein n=1 Tax=Bursaphelenchus xylophilus TaxID=6326 RepID=A0A1I7RVP0_BURXY|nr:unnamed protein product [Bursaphelenchus xylophilus]CAG9081949.1 unnamed protein product [Bursaphelenchus xylophilus]